MPGSGEGSRAGSYPSTEGVPAAGAGVKQDWLRPRIFRVSSAICVKGFFIPSLISSPAPRTAVHITDADKAGSFG